MLVSVENIQSTTNIKKKLFVSVYTMTTIQGTKQVNH